jgi:hypothetical protein
LLAAAQNTEFYLSSQDANVGQAHGSRSDPLGRIYTKILRFGPYLRARIGHFDRVWKNRGFGVRTGTESVQPKESRR